MQCCMFSKKKRCTSLLIIWQYLIIYHTSKFSRSSSNSSKSSSSNKSSSMAPATSDTALLPAVPFGITSLPASELSLASCSFVDSSTPSSIIPYSSNLISCTLVPSSSSCSLALMSTAQPSSSSSSSPAMVGLYENSSLPDKPVVRPDFALSFFLESSFLAFSAFSLNFRFFHLTNDSKVTAHVLCV